MERFIVGGGVRNGRAADVVLMVLEILGWGFRDAVDPCRARVVSVTGVWDVSKIDIQGAAVWVSLW